MDTSYSIAVIGAGLMGHGIALTLARAGHQVRLTDPVAAARASAAERITASLHTLNTPTAQIELILQRIEITDDTASAVTGADFVFEAAPEKLDLKRSVFAEIERYAPTTCILASNTSVMPITRIMGDLEHKNRALGTHWWNPAHMIPLVEIISTEWTDTAAADKTMALLRAAGKSPVHVKKDIPGFIGNRLQHALWREAISLVENDICDAEAVDTVIKASFGRRLAVLGPLENADLVGTDLTLDIHSNILFDLDAQREPSAYLRQLVQQGKLGMKSGAGFRTWNEGEAEQVRARVAHHLKFLEDELSD